MDISNVVYQKKEITDEIELQHISLAMKVVITHHYISLPESITQSVSKSCFEEGIELARQARTSCRLGG